MRKYIMLGGLLVFVIMARAEAGFLKNLPTGDFTTAGLQKLTPEELARLETLVQRYKTGEVPEVRQPQGITAPIPSKEADKKTVEPMSETKKAETKSNVAVTKHTDAELNAPSVPVTKPPSWFTALVALNQASEKPEKQEPLESRLMGNFVGWTGNTIFKLDNGTRWVQQNKIDTYIYSPILHSPKVKITPASIRGFWLEIEGVNLRVRVMPLELPEQK